MENFIVEDNVPIPPITGPSNKGVFTYLRQTLRTLEPGQSFVITDLKTMKQFHGAKRREFVENNKRFIGRKVSDYSWRVWRVS